MGIPWSLPRKKIGLLKEWSDWASKVINELFLSPPIETLNILYPEIFFSLIGILDNAFSIS